MLLRRSLRLYDGSVIAETYIRLLLLTSLWAVSVSADARPNILLIMADDLGVECLGAYGGTSYATPRLDSLAATGQKFLHGYSTPKCSPSRVTLLTGRYTFRTTRTWGHIPHEEISFGQVLKRAGYATALAGKWQLGRLVDAPGLVSHFGFEDSCVWGWHEGPRYWQPRIWQNGVLRTDVGDRYGPEVYTDFLIDFMATQREEPFLAYYPMCLTHFAKGNEPAGPSGTKETFKEMVEEMDRQIGRLVDALERLKLRDQTVILFTADNGSPTKVTSMQNGMKIKGGKALLTDAGTHVPLIANWPGTIEPGEPDGLIDFTDFLPTLAELGQGELPDDRVLDGQSFAGTLRGKPTPGRDWVFTEWAGHAWIRDHRWKLYDDGRLIDLQTDASEQSVLSPYSDDAERAQVRAWLGSKMAMLLDPAISEETK
ncbi:MAG: arylsulfatase A [Kiritimatiellia bacterium]|jgi:arylsulfatase A